MPCGWEGNRRSGVALAMRHRLQWLIIHIFGHAAQGREISTPPTVLMGYGTLYLFRSWSTDATNCTNVQTSVGTTRIQDAVSPLIAETRKSAKQDIWLFVYWALSSLRSAKTNIPADDMQLLFSVLIVKFMMLCLCLTNVNAEGYYIVGVEKEDTFSHTCK